MALSIRKTYISPKRLQMLVAIFIFAAIGAYIVITSHAATDPFPPCAPYCHPSLKTGTANFLQGPDWFNQNLAGNNYAGRSYGHGAGDDEYGLGTSRLVVLAFGDWRLINTIPNYKVGTIVEFKVWLYGNKSGAFNDISQPRVVQFGKIDKITHFGAGDVYRDPGMVEVLSSDFENKCFKAPTEPARIQGNQYYIGTFKIKILQEVARTTPSDPNSPSRTWALNIPHYVAEGSECGAGEKYSNIVVPTECALQVSVTCSAIDAPGVGDGSGPDKADTGGKTTKTSGSGGGSGASAKKQGDQQNSIPSTDAQGENKQPDLEPSPFFDGKQYDPGSDPDVLGVDTTFSVAGHRLKYGWAIVTGILLAAGSGVGYWYWRKRKGK